MAIVVNNPITDIAEFYRQLRNYVGQVEGDKEIPYWDSNKIPTIGVGFNLRAQGSREAVFDELKITDSALRKALTQIITDTSISEAELGPRLDEIYGQPFIMTSAQIDNVFSSPLKNTEAHQNPLP